MTKIKIPIEKWTELVGHLDFTNENDFSKYIEDLVNNLFEYHSRRLICEALKCT